MGSGAFSNAVYKVGNGKFLKISRAASLEKKLGGRVEDIESVGTLQREQWDPTTYEDTTM